MQGQEIGFQPQFYHLLARRYQTHLLSSLNLVNSFINNTSKTYSVGLRWRVNETICNTWSLGLCLTDNFSFCLFLLSLTFSFNDLKSFQIHSRHSIYTCWMNELLLLLQFYWRLENDHGIWPLDGNWCTQRLLKCLGVLNTRMK